MLIKARVTARYDFATLIDKKARSTFYRSLIIKHWCLLFPVPLRHFGDFLAQIFKLSRLFCNLRRRIPVRFRVRRTVDVRHTVNDVPNAEADTQQCHATRKHLGCCTSSSDERLPK